MQNPISYLLLLYGSIAAGLFMMAFFTGLWAGIAYGGLYTSSFRFGLIFFLVLIIAFVIQDIKQFRVAHHHPEIKTEAEAAGKKRVGNWSGLFLVLKDWPYSWRSILLITWASGFDHAFA